MSEQIKPDKAAAPPETAAKTEAKTEVNANQPKLDLPSIEAPAIQPSMDTRIEMPATAAIPALERIKRKNAKRATSEDASPEPAQASEPAATEAPAPARSNKFALLAASVALAAAFGGLVGGLAGPTPAAAPPQGAIASDETRALRDSIAQIKTELGALRTAIEAGTRNTNTQFTKVGERFDRVERAQAVPAATLTKAVEALDRLERRAQPANASADVTGSIAAQPAAGVPTPPARPAILEGWVVRDVYRGVALLQGRRLGTIEVEAGDSIPGVGRIESIKRQDGRWVVVTPKGLITSTR
jgi:hypothetical protein